MSVSVSACSLCLWDGHTVAVAVAIKIIIMIIIIMTIMTIIMTIVHRARPPHPTQCGATDLRGFRQQEAESRKQKAGKQESRKAGMDWKRVEWRDTLIPFIECQAYSC